MNNVVTAKKMKDNDDRMDRKNRFKTMTEAQDRAELLTNQTGEHHVAYESNYSINRFIAQRLPQVGDDASMGFNGDYYPCGKIVRISPTYNRITTSNGVAFTRVGPCSWVRGGKRGTFSLIQGVINRRNPEF